MLMAKSRRRSAVGGGKIGARGARPLCMTTRRPRGRPPHQDVLTPAEWRVAEAVRHGMTNAQIAARQGVSLEAVKFHVANARSKLGLSRRAELRHWDGVRRDSRLFGRPSDMTAEIALGPIGQIARGVADITTTETKNHNKQSLPHLYTFGDLAFFD